MSISWVRYYTIVMQDVSIERNWVKGIGDLSVLFFPLPYKSVY